MEGRPDSHEVIYWIRGVIHIRRSLRRVTKKFLGDETFRRVERIGKTGLAIVPPNQKNLFVILKCP